MVTGDDGHRADAQSDGAWLTIEELSRRTDMSVRNIRAHQSRGLLARPCRRGRVGYYSPAYVERLLRIAQLQAQGFNLASIAAALDGSAEGRSDHRRLQRLALAPLLRDDTVVVPREALAEMFDHARGDASLSLAAERRTFDRLHLLAAVVLMGTFATIVRVAAEERLDDGLAPVGA